DIDLSDLPELEARLYRGPSDHAAMADMLNRWHRATGAGEVASVDELDHNYAHIENCDPKVDMVMIADRSGRLVGYTRTEWWQVVDGERKYAVFAKVDPDWGESRLPFALLSAAERHNLGIATTHDVACSKVLEGWARDDHEQAMVAAYLELGFVPVTYEAVMVRADFADVPDAWLPEGVETRAVEASHLRSIWEADKEAFRDHWGYAEPSEQDYLRFLEFPHRDESLWKVAWAGDTVVGQVRSFINQAENAELDQERGWTEFISTHREWRGRGVARALICASLRELESRGMTEAALGVHTENPTGAFSLYESLGYEVVERSTTFQKPFD
ncbi:MAG: GNAT family N-acetyltransferase, partial [Acidimicrobiia bacterium]